MNHPQDTSTYKTLSLGAGVQSSTIFLMACYGEIETPDMVIFADTGWEPKKVYEWLVFLEKEGQKYGLPIHKISKGNIKQDALVNQVRGKKEQGKRWASMPYYTRDRKTGNDGMIKRQCTAEYKIAPIEKKVKELAGFKKYQRLAPGVIETWKGISTDETRRAKLSTQKWNTFYYPLIEMGMSRQDCLKWFESKGLPEPPRSSCLGCPFHSNKEWRLIKENPEEWREVVEFDRKIRNLGGMRGDVYLHSDRLPLDEIDFRTLEEMGQQNMFDNECAGVCGV